jgi:hypothetical protein
MHAPAPAEKDTFIDMIKIGSEWFVLVVEDGRETGRWFSIESAAIAYAGTQVRRLKVERLYRL